MGGAKAKRRSSRLAQAEPEKLDKSRPASKKRKRVLTRADPEKLEKYRPASKRQSVVLTRAAAQVEKSTLAIYEDESESSADDHDLTESNLHNKTVINDKSVDVVDQALSVRKARVTLSCGFLGKPLAKAEATRRWPHRYAETANTKALPNGNVKQKKKTTNDESKQVKCVAHYSRAEVDRKTFELGDCVYVNADSSSDYLARIIELFELSDHSKWLRLQWFFRVEETALRIDGLQHDRKRIFYSDQMDDNPLEILVEKIKVIRVRPPPKLSLSKKIIPKCDYYYDMGYNTKYSTFYELPEEFAVDTGKESSTLTSTEETNSVRSGANDSRIPKKNGRTAGSQQSPECSPNLNLLDLYSGCGAMSSGLCMGARFTGAKLVTKWAVDLNKYACTTLKYNHPETEVRNESTEDFLALIKEWQKLCKKYCSETAGPVLRNQESEKLSDGGEFGEVEYEVEKIVGVRYIGSYVQKESKSSFVGLQFKVRWKGFGTADDTWEPISNLKNSQERIREFVIEGKSKKILPLPGECDVICGGPPCQGVSGFNRFRNKLEPLQCTRNKQMIVYMDIVEFLKPRFAVMENVVDILKFVDGILGRYALGRLVQMHYQARLGLLVAGCYGLPQFRMRVFILGAAPGERLPPFPLPTHTVVIRGHAPQSWEQNVVAYDESETPTLEEPLFLGDAISDLPKIANSDKKDEMFYDKSPATMFQTLIRLPKDVHESKQPPKGKHMKAVLYDHRSYELNVDDYQRSCQIPKRKGANFRDLDGIIILRDGTVDVERKNRCLLPSGKPLVPDYALSFSSGKSLKPFGRLWWDETVPTVLTRPIPHSQCSLHPDQDRVLSIRESARLQGFPDFYKLCGPVQERYTQVGNAVAIPVARAIGFGLGHALQSHNKASCKLLLGNPILIQLPKGFPFSSTDMENLQQNS